MARYSRINACLATSDRPNYMDKETGLKNSVCGRWFDNLPFFEAITLAVEHEAVFPKDRREVEQR
jgi:hypothetical protein